MSEFDIYKKAKLRAMHLLERADRTEQGLRDKLLASYPEEVTKEAMDYVKSFGYIDDTRYAQNYLRFRCQTKSRKQLFQELQRKGISRQVIDQAWEEVAAEEEVDERSLLRELVRKKYPAGSQLDERQMRRLHGYLGRRGFSWEDIRAVLSEENICLEKEPY